VSSDRGPECAGKAIPGSFELAELVQHNEIAARGDVVLHGGGRGAGAGPVEVALRRPRPQVVKDRKPSSRREVPQIARRTETIGQAVAFSDDPRQTKLPMPTFGQRPEEVLDFRIRCAPYHGDGWCGLIHFESCSLAIFNWI
jgi:hypothetical protein